MARLVVMYRTPKDVAAFDKHYFETDDLVQIVHGQLQTASITSLLE